MKKLAVSFSVFFFTLSIFGTASFAKPKITSAQLKAAKNKARALLLSPDLLNFHISPAHPRQGDEVTIFIQPKTTFKAPKQVNVFLTGTLDSQGVTLLNPSDQLWILKAGRFETISSHHAAFSVGIEDAQQAKQVREALSDLADQIASLQDQIAHETDPGQLAQLQQQLTAALAQKTDLEEALTDLQKIIGQASFDFSIDAAVPGGNYPRITSVDPLYGETVGGETITLIGENFTPGSRVFVGGIEGTSVQVTGTTQIQFVSPAQSQIGTKNIEVTVPVAGGGVRNAVLTNAFVVIPQQQAPQPSRPVANAGQPQASTINAVTSLDGSLSYDEDSLSISYSWSLVSKPETSQLTNTSITNGATAHPSFTPDVNGIYVFSLVVNDGSLDSLPSLTVVEVRDYGRLEFSPATLLGVSTPGDQFTFEIYLCNPSHVEQVTAESVAIVGEANPGEFVFVGTQFTPGGQLVAPIVLQPQGCSVFGMKHISSVLGERLIQASISGHSSRAVSATLNYTSRIVLSNALLTAGPLVERTDLDSVADAGVFVPLFDFTLTDPGGDGFATLVSHISFGAQNPQSFSFAFNPGDVWQLSGPSGTYTTTVNFVEFGQFGITFQSLNIAVAEGTSETYVLSVKLGAPSVLSDIGKTRISLNGANVGTAGRTGMAPGQELENAPLFDGLDFHVTAARLVFPQFNPGYSPTIGASEIMFFDYIDDYGNQDADVNGDVITLTRGDGGSVVQGMSRAAENGRAYFDGAESIIFGGPAVSPLDLIFTDDAAGVQAAPLMLQLPGLLP